MTVPRSGQRSSGAPTAKAARAGAHVPPARARRLAGAPPLAGHEAASWPRELALVGFDRALVVHARCASRASWPIGLLVARIPLGAFPRLPRGRLPAAPVRSRPQLACHDAAGRAPRSGADQPRRARRGGPVPRARPSCSSCRPRSSGGRPNSGRSRPRSRGSRARCACCGFPSTSGSSRSRSSLRCLPLLIDEMRTLAAARRLRHRDADDQTQRTPCGDRAARPRVDRDHRVAAAGARPRRRDHGARRDRCDQRQSTTARSAGGTP